jgi:tetratricopeptide (TPR) repeat protein
VIEIMLQGERMLALGRLDEAEKLYRQAADADPHNSIAVVGLARIAVERGDDPAAYRFAQRALAIDPENAAADRLARRLDEVYAYRGQSIAELAREPGVAVTGVVAEPSPEEAAAAPEPPAESTAPSTPAPDAAPTPPAGADHRGLVDRLLRRSRP